jgi:hypothetical protein
MSVIGIVALGLAVILALIVMIAFPAVRVALGRMASGTVILLLGLGLVILLLLAITRFDPTPLLRQLAVAQTGNRVVDFFAVLPDRYKVKVQEVENVDTDGDGEKEWVVLYRFDLTDGRSPYAGAIYDYDRGDPPVIFPYQLVPPDRDYLSDSAISLQLNDLIKLGETKPVPEVFITGNAGGINTDLTIFRHVPNSLPWEFPRDEPRRYQVIGSFRGDGGVRYDATSKTVTVLNRGGYDRAQLAVQNVYSLDETRGTFMSAADPKELGAPASSQVVFAFGMPPDILETPYPEKLVLGFYKALAQKQSSTIKPEEFLTGQALIEYSRGNLLYFGFPDVSGDVTQVKVTQLSYSPQTEAFDASVTVLGQEPRFLTVSIGFESQVGASVAQTPRPVEWVTTLVNGKWKIDHRL